MNKLTPLAAASELMANAVRALAMDAVETAKSGHPGMPMGMADVAAVLFNRFIKLDPADPDWPDRDRFVLSAGHGSMLLYALHHLLGYADMGIDQLRAFRQLGSRTAGHPEYGHAPGIEVTTGPLGPGHRHRGRHGAGRAAAGGALRRRPARPLHLCRRRRRLPDGRHQPGGDRPRRAPAARQADRALGRQPDHHRRRRPTLSTSIDQAARFRASGWRALEVDGHDPDAVAAAIDDRPGHPTGRR